MHRKLGVGLWVVAGLLLALVVFLYFFDWNHVRPFIARKSREAIGRELKIAGDLRVHWSLSPRVTADEVTLQNAAWAKRPSMFKADHVEVSVALLSLFRQRLELPLLRLDGAFLNLERDSEGKGNWAFDTKTNAGSPDTNDVPAGKANAPRLPALTEALVQDFDFDFLDTSTGVHSHLRLDKLSTHEDRGGEEVLSLTGSAGSEFGAGRDVKQSPLKIDARLGALQGILSSGQPWPLTVKATFADLHLDATGSVKRPRELDGVDLKVASEGHDLTRLLLGMGFNVGTLPPFRAAARLVGGAGIWQAKDLDLILGQTEVSGSVEIDMRNRLKVSATLSSPLVRVDDLSPLLLSESDQAPSLPATAPAKRSAGTPSAQVFSSKPFALTALRLVDVDLIYKVKRATSSAYAVDLIDDGALEAHLKDGLLRVKPFTVSLSNGHLEANGVLDGRRDIASGSLNVALEQLDLGRLVRKAGAGFKNAKAAAGKTIAKPVAKEVDRISKNTFGLLGGRLALTSTGNSPKALMQTLRGEAGIAMEHGHISEVLTYVTELDAGKAISRYIEGDKGSPVDCLLVTFKVERGDAKADTILLATDTANIEGEGDVDLGQEKVKLKLTPHPKKVSFDSLRTPLVIEGPLTHPTVKPEVKGLIARIGAAIALGALAAPAAALLPFIEAGLGKKGACATHVRELAALQPKPGQVKRPASVPTSPTH